MKEGAILFMRMGLANDPSVRGQGMRRSLCDRMNRLKIIPCPLTDCCIGWLWDLAEEYMGFKGIAVCCTVRFNESEMLGNLFLFG